MGFKGAVVSDYWGIDELSNAASRRAGSRSSAAVRALKAGVDFDLPDGDAYAKLPEALAAGRVTQAEIDQAVRRMLRLKFLAGPVREPVRGCEVRARRSRTTPKLARWRGSRAQARWCC